VYANSLVNDHSQAEDIVQNVFIRTWVKREKLHPDYSIKSYLYKSIFNEFIDQYRRQQSVSILEKKYIEALDAIVEEDQAVFEQLLGLVQKEIQTLPPKCRKIFQLSKQDGLSNIEISEHLNISIKTVEAHMTKAFRILREKTRKKVPLETVIFFLFAPSAAKRQTLSLPTRL
jgi:RNA polymerase sigma-70 factor (ECF subfamily)